MTTTENPTAVYTLGTDPKERERLRRQAIEIRPHAEALLDRIGVQPGWNVLDLGCGLGGTLDLLASRVGPTGKVVGVDVNPSHVTHARALVADEGLSNVEVLEADARDTGLPTGSFDLVYARLILVNVPDPAEILAEMIRVARPGGYIASEEADTTVHLCHPPHPAWDRLNHLFETTYRSDGADPAIGRRLHELYRQAGLVDINLEARADVPPISFDRRTLRPDLVRSMRTKILERELVTEPELDELDHQVRDHLADPSTIAMPYLHFMASGRTPLKSAPAPNAAVEVNPERWA
jgi:ubiquinone/menaquinone biosynthesis C-methylase UbiE